MEQDWKQRATALKDLPRFLHLVWGACPTGVSGTVLLRLISGLAPVGMLYVAKRVVDLISAAANGKHPDLHTLWFWIALEFGLSALSQVIGKGIDLLDALVADRFNRALALKIMRHAATLDLASFEDATFQDSMERARTQATDRTAMLTSLGSLIQRFVMLLSLAGGILVYSPWVLAALVLSTVPVFLVESHFAFLGYVQSHELTPLRRLLDYYLTLGSSAESAKEVKVFALAPYLDQKYQTLSQEILDQHRRLALRRLAWGAVVAVGASVAYYGSYAYVAWEAFAQRLTLGTFTFLVGAIAGANGHLQTIFTLFSGVADQALFLHDLIVFLEEKPRIQQSETATPPPEQVQTGLVFEDVTFQYPGGNKPVLDHISFRLERNQRVALVGENGEGKTTLVKLLTRLYDPTSGRIVLDGKDLREYKLEELRGNIGLIFQDFIHYDLSLRENIAVGDISRLTDDEALCEACRKSSADEVFENLPGQLDQMLGRRFEGGADLSGGEWQRIALARAYLRDAQILILDEPTAALDPLAEHEVFQKFVDLTSGKLALFISHRFSSVRMADRILVLSKGKIIQDGPHEALVNQPGLYAELFEAQAASYR